MSTETNPGIDLDAVRVAIAPAMIGRPLTLSDVVPPGGTVAAMHALNAVPALIAEVERLWAREMDWHLVAAGWGEDMPDSSSYEAACRLGLMDDDPVSQDNRHGE